jgi:hypothetical protein
MSLDHTHKEVHRMTKAFGYDDAMAIGNVANAAVSDFVMQNQLDDETSAQVGEFLRELLVKLDQSGFKITRK